MSSDVSGNVSWEQPPPARGERSARFAILAPKIKANPGKWAVVERGLTQYRSQAAVMASRIKAGDYQPFQPEGEWDATSSKEGNVYVMWIGPGGQHKPKLRDVEPEWEGPPSRERPDMLQPDPSSGSTSV